MKVIARNNGPIFKKWDGSEERRGLKKGKIYDVIHWSYQKPLGVWIFETKDFINPREPKFFIKVVNENGNEAVYWNDYFFSGEEIRDVKISKLLNE